MSGGPFLRAAIAALAVVASLLVAAAAQSREGEVDLHLFWRRGCPHCESQIEHLAALEARDPAVRVHYYELGDAQNRRLYAATARSHDVREPGVPLTVLGDRALVGARTSPGAVGALEEWIAQCRRGGCVDTVGAMARELSAVTDRALAMREIDGGAESPPALPGIEPAADRVRLPGVGEIDLRALSLPALTVVLAAVDGFNPCALWVLAFLIGLLLGLQDRARRWLLGGAFLLTTAVVYYLVMAAWLGALLVIGASAWLRNGIGLVALAAGAYYVQEYLRHPEALCRVAGEARRQRIMARLRAASAEPSFLAALAAIIVIAVGVNLIELLCSAGIPAIYTQILALTPMPAWQHHAWLALYVLVFLLDDLALFVGAMLALEVTGAGTRYAHRAQLVGGVVLLTVGVLLILRPEYLYFG